MNSITRRDFIKTSYLTAAGASLGATKVWGENNVNPQQISEHPNVLVIMTDQQSADAVSCEMGKIGKNYLHTPVMDRLCNEGVSFERAYCANPLCFPSRSSMLTGRYPHELGIQTNDLPQESRDFARNLTSLGTAFRNSGYNTGYLGKLHSVYGIFDFNDDFHGHGDKDIEHGFEYSANMGHNGIDPKMLAPAEEFFNKQRDKKEPFFLFVNYNNPHNICEWARGDRGEELPDGAVEEPPLDICPPLRTNHLPPEDEIKIMSFMRRSYQATGMSPVADYTEADWRKYQWAKYKMTEIVDRRIGRLLQALRDYGHQQDTLVVFLSDHGDMQGAHRWNQKTVFFDESTRVPLTFHWPGVITPGTRRQLVHTGIDFIPTLCGLAGVTPPEGLPGRNLKDVILGNDREDREYIVCSNYFAQGAEVGGVKLEPHGRMVRSQRYKYCAYDKGETREELYDMIKDPGEMKNIAYEDEYQEPLKQHRRYLAEHCRKYDDDFPH